MKHVCKICGYIYDDGKEDLPFDKLPENWVCPVCGAAKTEFEAQGGTASVKKPAQFIKKNGDMFGLSVGQLSAVCSNLARGCEKQYKMYESGLFTELAEYFAAVTPAEESAEVSALNAALSEDLQSYGMANAAAEGVDRGALRVCAWGEKVTRILSSLLRKYLKDGEKFLADTEVWVCSVCGFVYVGDNPPDLCPVCKVPSWKFEKTAGRAE